jgi:hypothetical protein
LRRMVAKVEEYSESHRAHGLPDDLLNILRMIWRTRRLARRAERCLAWAERCSAGCRAERRSAFNWSNTRCRGQSAGRSPSRGEGSRRGYEW